MGLFTPKWLTRKDETLKLEDESKLQRAYLEGKNPEIRLIAARRISDPGFLASIITSMPPINLTQEQKDAARAAVTNLSKRDQNTLSQTVTVKNEYVRNLVVSALNDQSTLAMVAAGDPDKTIRKNACSRLNDPSALCRIVLSEKDEGIQDTAVRRISDQTMLCQIAQSEVQPGIRAEAVKRLSDPNLVLNSLLNTTDEGIRKSAINRLTALRDLNSLKSAFHAMDAVPDRMKIAAVLKELQDPEAIDWLEDQKPKAPENAVFAMRISRIYPISGTGWFNEGRIEKGIVTVDMPVKIATHFADGEPHTWVSAVTDIRKNGRPDTQASEGEIVSLRMRNITDDCNLDDWVYSEG